MLIFYVRHGQPDYKSDSLTELGEIEAKALVSRFKDAKIDKIYSSPLNRAVMTAKPTADFLKLPINVVDWASEALAWNVLSYKKDNYQIWYYQHKESLYVMNSIEVRNLQFKWYNHSYFKSNFSIIPYFNDVGYQIDEFLCDLGYAHNHSTFTYKNLKKGNKQRIALFAHQGFFTVFMSQILDIPYPEIATRFDLGHTGVTVIYFDPDADEVIPKVLQISNDSHLFKEGVETIYNDSVEF